MTADTTRTPTQHSGSDSDIGNTDYINRFVSNRNKKRRVPNTPPQEESTKNMVVYMEEMRSLISTLSIQQEKRLCEMKISLDAQYSDIKESIHFLSEKYENVLAEIQTLKDDKQKDRKCIKQLEDKIEILERQTRSTSLELRNLPTNTE